MASRVKGKKAFYSDKKVIDNKGELLVKLDTSKFKKAQNHIHITAVFKTKVNDKEKGAYMNLANHLVLYYEKKLNDIVENVSAIKVAKGKVERVALEREEKMIIFPLLVKPENDINSFFKEYYWAAPQKSNMATFNSNRDQGRKHAGRDLYTNPNETVVAICDGIVLQIKEFYMGTHQVSIKHKTKDGREFIVRYGELASNSITVKEGNPVKQKQIIGKTGFLKKENGSAFVKRKGKILYMLHFEYFSDFLKSDLKNEHPLSNDKKPYYRRADLLDSLSILQEGYLNTFGEGKEKLFTVDDAKNALKELYNKYKDKVWNWKWEGSKTEIIITGEDLVKIIERIYRLETSHFTSEQFKHCGTGGMEVFGEAPFYGWDSNLFIETPVGIWSAFESKGLSGAGGNAQETNKKKKFVKLPSVLAGMEYKAKYIIKYEGNYERWYNARDANAQKLYRESLKKIKAKFIEEFKK